MKKLISTILIALILTTNSVFAATYSDSFIREEVRKQINIQNKKYTNADLEIIISSMPFKTMTVSDGKIKFVVTSNFDKFVPRDIKKVYVYVNGKLEREFLVQVRTLAYKNVLCAKTQLERESLLSNANVTAKRMEVSMQLDYVLTPEMLRNKNIITKKWFREGEIIDKRFVRIKPDVERNSEVQAYFKNNGVMIMVSGKALNEGMVGDYINVQNDTYKRTYKARVIGENKVLINI